jgi:hypothetical protein
MMREPAFCVGRRAIAKNGTFPRAGEKSNRSYDAAPAGIFFTG